MGRSRIVFAVVLTACLATAVQAGVLSFQEGAAGYTGTTDTVLTSFQPNNNWGGREYMQIREYTIPLVGLIKFDNIFGTGAGQIPLTATAADVTSAMLTLTNWREEVSGTTPSQTLWPVITPWVEGTGDNQVLDGVSTWNHRIHQSSGSYTPATDFWGTTTPTENIGLLFGQDTFGSSATPIASVPSQNRGAGTQNVTFNPTDFDVTDAVKAWIDGTYANEGFLLGHLNSSSISSFELWYTSESISANARPKLTVTIVPPSGETEHEWAVDASGSWSQFINWSTGAVPNGNDTTATFADGITTSRTVFTDGAVTVKNITFGDTNAGTTQQSYAIAGNSQTGSVTFDSDTSVSTISALEGSHQFQVVVNLNNATTVSVGDTEPSASLAFNNALNLGGNTLTKTGPGTLNINNQLNGGGGSVTAAAGTVSGFGTIGGNLTNSGATVAPGNSPGKLTVEGNYVHEAGSSLTIEIGGLLETQEYDVLNVSGSMTLNGGTLDVVLIDGFVPSGGDSFDILDFSSLTGDFTSVNLPAGFNWNESLLLTDGILSIGLTGDFDFDGDVDGADFLVWQRGFGTTHNAADIADWQTYFGTTAVAASASAVPEPTSAGLLVMALGALVLVGRRRG